MWGFSPQTFSGDHLINTYKEYMATISDASADFAISAGLALISGLSQRRVIIPSMSSKILYPNLWIMLLGASGISRKSTTIWPVRRIVNDIAPDILLPDKMTEESTFMYFNKRHNSQAFLIADEFAGTLANLDKQYAMGYKQLLMKLYDCIDHEKRTLKTSEEEIKNAYLSILAGGTPIGVMKYLSDKDIESGFLPRFMIVYPPLPTPRRILKRTAKADTLLRRVAAEAFMYSTLLSVSTIHAVYDFDAFDYISSYYYNKELEVRKNYSSTNGSLFAREMEQTFKVSTLIALDHLIESASDPDLTHLLRDIKYQKPKSKTDKDGNEIKVEPSVYGSIMSLIDSVDTGKKMAIAFTRFVKGFGDSFGVMLSGISKDYGSYIAVYNAITSSKSLLDAYETGIFSVMNSVVLPLRVTIDDVTEAIEYIEAREKDSINIYKQIEGGRNRRVADKVLEFIKRRGQVSHSVVLRGLNMHKDDLKNAIQQLVEEDRIEIMVVGTRKKKRIYVAKKEKTT